MEGTKVPNRSTIFPGLRQLLPPIHQRLLTDSKATNGTDQENGKMGIERGGRKCIPGAKKTIYFGPDPGPLRPPATGHY